jgi:endonuclease/exonuclease/phosphatase family metal-dependent hydrolase
MPYRFAPAADAQFGNALLARLPLEHWEAGLLPRGDAPQSRSYILGVIHVGERQVTVIGTHLDHRQTDIRLLQTDSLIDVWNETPYTVIAGDINAKPSTPEIAVFESAGFINAQDEAGDPAMMTFSSLNPVARIDWIFGTRDLTFSDFVIPQTTASDHLPIAATVTLP